MCDELNSSALTGVSILIVLELLLAVLDCN